MSETTKIQWCDSTWNPWRGCTKVSAGCANCYADRLCNRFGIKFGHGEKRVMSKPATFNAPLRWNKKPWVCDEYDLPDSGHRRRVFLGSLMDIFDPEVPISDFALALNVVRHCNELDWLLVTKRPELFSQRISSACDWWAGKDAAHHEWMDDWVQVCKAPHNVTIIATVENQEMADKRIPELLRIPARRRGLSIEPLLGPVDLKLGIVNYDAFDWVIVGGESGPGARPCNVEWILGIVQQCAAAEVPCFVKQLGSMPMEPDDTYGNGALVQTTMRDKKGSDPVEWPEDLRVQQWMEDDGK